MADSKSARLLLSEDERYLDLEIPKIISRLIPELELPIRRFACVRRFGALDQIDMMDDVALLLADPTGRAISGAMGHYGTGPDPVEIAQSVTLATSRLKQIGGSSWVQKYLQHCSVEVDGNFVMLSDDFDVIMSGKMIEIVALILWVTEINYAPFLGGAIAEWRGGLQSLKGPWLEELIQEVRTTFGGDSSSN